MEINATRTVKIDAKILKIFTKVCDSFCCELYDNFGLKLKSYEGYVPDFMPEDHDGDYLFLDIDIDTGHIINWTVPSHEDIERFINQDD